MRTWHRWVGTTTGLFVAAIAVSGVVLQGQFLVNDTATTHQNQAEFCVVVAPQDEASSALLPRDEIPQMIATTLQAAQKVTNGAGIAALKIQMIDNEPEAKLAVMSPGSTEVRELTFYARTGEPVDVGYRAAVSLPAAKLPVCKFEFDEDLHRWLLDFHTGHMFGDSGKWISLLTGLGLTILSVTGLLVYLDMLLRRIRQLGKRELFWR